MVSISDMKKSQYWKFWGSMMDKAKEKIPKQHIIGDIRFMSLATIEGNLFTIHPKNPNHVQKDSNDLLSVIIILGTYVHGRETVFNDGGNMNAIGKRAHVLKHSHGRCVVGTFDKNLHEGSIWTGHIFVLSLSSTNQYFFTLYIMVQYL